MITNPILRGFHPDASVCAVGGEYYIAVSTFEWWPGVLIYHSRDLANLEQVHLAVKVREESLQFYYGWKETAMSPLGELLPAEHLSDDYIRDSALVFTGAMVGICVQDLYDHSAYADFDRFYYIEIEEENNPR